MTISKRLMILTTIFSGLLLLSACGDDSSTASAPAASEPAAAPAAEASMEAAPAASDTSSVLDGVERAEGVVYQDEIYANWPYN